MHLKKEEKLIIKTWIEQDPYMTPRMAQLRVQNEFCRTISERTIRILLRALGAKVKGYLNQKERLIIKEWIGQDPNITKLALREKIKNELKKTFDISTMGILRKTLGANVRPHITLTDAEKLTVQKWIEQNPNIDKKLLRQKIQNELCRTVSESTVARLIRKAKTILNSTH